MKLLKGQKLRDDRKAKVPPVKHHIAKVPLCSLILGKLRQCQKVMNRGMPQAKAFKGNQRRYCSFSGYLTPQGPNTSHLHIIS